VTVIESAKSDFAFIWCKYPKSERHNIDKVWSIADVTHGALTIALSKKREKEFNVSHEPLFLSIPLTRHIKTSWICSTCVGCTLAKGYSDTQKFACRMCSKSWNAGYDELLEMSHLPSLSDRRLYLKLCSVIKISSGRPGHISTDLTCSKNLPTPTYIFILWYHIQFHSGKG